jgi:pimeloyl-ACP methyl ester carboxylesterase
LLLGIIVIGFVNTDCRASSLPEETAVTVEVLGGQKIQGFRGSFSVPEDRHKNASRRITLYYVRLPATVTLAGPPIVYLAGGPGASGIDAIRYRYAAFNAMRRYGDVIALDQRGTGVSNDLPTCLLREILPSDRESSDEQFSKTRRAALSECLAFWRSKGVDEAAYNTRENALDLDDLRRHLRTDKIVLWGTSYGAQLALAAMRQLPDYIDRAVLSSVRGLDQNWKLPATLEPYLDRLQRAVDTQPGARAAYGDIRELMRRVHAALDRSPVPIALKDGDGASVAYLLHRRDMQLLAVSLFADPSGAARMLNIYRALDEHRDPAIDRIPTRLLPDHLVAPGQPVSLECMPTLVNIASGISRARRKSVLAQTPGSLFGEYLDMTRPYDGMAKELDVGGAFRKAPASSTPTLLFSGTLDGRTVLEEQREATVGLTRVTRVTVENAGHNLFDALTPELLSALDQFMTNRPVESVTIVVAAPRFVSDDQPSRTTR